MATIALSLSTTSFAWRFTFSLSSKGADERRPWIFPKKNDPKKIDPKNMTQKELIENAVKSFVETVNTEKVVQTLNEKREFLAPWVCSLIDTELPCYVQVSSILYALFEDCVCGVGETISSKCTAKYCPELRCEEPYGEVLEVSEMRGHVWVRWCSSDIPLAHFEISVYDSSI